MITHLLSKSTFVRGCQCHKSLYLNKYHRELKDDVSEMLQLVFDTGQNVGELAQDLFPGGEYGTFPGEIPSYESVKRTNQLIDAGVEVIYEATFLFDEVIVAMDILVKGKKGWEAYEVKSSTSVSETYIKDASIQSYVIKGSGFSLNDISIIHINKQYVKRGAIDVNQLFIIESVYDSAMQNQDWVRINIKEFKKVLKQDQIPDIQIGPHCSDPYECDFTGHCWQHVPDNSVFSYKGLTGKRKWELFDNGYITIDDIPADQSLNNTEQLVVDCEKNNVEYIDKDAIRSFVNQLKYPLYYLDFETLFMVTIPIYDNSRPFQQIPFQYSLHIQQVPGEKVEHKEFLAEASRETDPRTEFINKLIADIGNTGSIVTYNASFEMGKLKDIKEAFPHYSNSIDAINARVVDQMAPFRARHFYKPEMKGSYSIKKVLPALVPELSYEGMPIADGGAASAAFLKLLDETDQDVITKTRKALLEYCELDTWAMVKIQDVLNKT
ncbi:MAG: DUF2779 domain-containing protein [Marinilabiliales bacterium]|nr:MAG: DUF2779 domain-containing protein [Marinilabiliales bacterium]